MDERVTSGKDGFNSVDAPKMFPAIGGAAATPTAQEVREDKDSASTAMIFGIAGTALGVLGLAAAAFALTRKPAAAASGAQPRETVGSSSGRGPQGG